MPRHLGRGLLVLLLLLLGPSGRLAASEPDDAVARPDVGFLVGERLVYNIIWGVIPVGRSEVSTAWVEEEGRPLLRIQARTRSNGAISSIYPVDDVLESFVDPVTFRPVRFVRNLKEGRKRHHDVTTFDFTAMTAHWHSYVKNKQRSFPLEPDSRDLVTFMYYMRRHQFEPGTTSQFRVMADDKLYGLSVQAFSTEPVKLERYGKITSLKMEPTASFEGLFVRKGRMLMWVSTDDRRLMTKAEVETPFANVRLVLEEVHGPGKDAWVKRVAK